MSRFHSGILCSVTLKRCRSRVVSAISPFQSPTRMQYRTRVIFVTSPFCLKQNKLRTSRVANGRSKVKVIATALPAPEYGSGTSYSYHNTNCKSRPKHTGSAFVLCRLHNRFFRAYLWRTWYTSLKITNTRPSKNNSHYWVECNKNRKTSHK